jgi:hypothetical protein
LCAIEQLSEGLLIATPVEGRYVVEDSSLCGTETGRTPQAEHENDVQEERRRGREIFAAGESKQ